MSQPSAPDSLVAQTNGDSAYIDLTWNNNGYGVNDAYTAIEIQYKVSTWHTLTSTYNGTREYYNNFPANPNVTYTFRVRGYELTSPPQTIPWSNWSNEDTATCWSTDAEASMAMVPAVTDSVEENTEFSTTCSTSMAMVPAATAVLSFTTTAATSMGMVPAVSEVASTQQDYEYYLGGDDGAVYEFSKDYTGDAGTEIASQWVSKNTDFSDQDPECVDKWKTVHAVKLYYIDESSSTEFSVALSKDDGTNWIDTSGTVSKSCGTGTGEIQTKTWWFQESAQFFKFRVIHGSSDKSFRIIGIEPEFEILGRHFEI